MFGLLPASWFQCVRASLVFGVIGGSVWLLFSHSASARDGVTVNSIKVGQSISLTGGASAYGVAVNEGVNLYLSETNRKGGVNGRRIELITLDDEGNAAKAYTNARALLDTHNVFVLFGSIEGGPSTAIMKAANEMSVPFIGPMAGSPTLRLPHNPYVFPVRADHTEEFKVILRHAALLGLQRVGFLRSASDVGNLHAANINRICQEFKLQLVGEFPYTGSPTDVELDSFVAQIEQKRVDVVLNHGGHLVYERLVRKVRAKGLRTVFYGVNSGSSQLVERLGKLAHGMGFTQVVPNPKFSKERVTQLFRTSYRTVYQKEPSYGALEGYMTAWVLVEALKRAGSQPTRTQLISGLYSAPVDVGGYAVKYTLGDHAGLKSVDLAVVSKDGFFQH